MTERINSRFDSPVEKRFYQDGKVGATAGWTVRAADDTWMSTCAASATAGTLVMPLPGLKEGDVIHGFHLLGQIESAGNTATLDCALYEFVPAAAASAAAALSGASMTQVSVTADTKLDDGNTKKTLDATNRIVVRRDRTYFALLTATTAASTDIELLGLMLHVDPQR